MFWLYTTNTFFDFYQVFVDYEIEFHNLNNTIYCLESNTKKIDIENNYDKNNFLVRIKDHLISYSNDQGQIVFSYKMNMCLDENKPNLLIFNYKYKKTISEKMPNLNKKEYDVNNTYEFKIYKINEKIQYIIETNTETEIIRKYFLTTELNLVDIYIDKK